MSTLKERVDDIIDDLKGRFRNPLILSFILTWLYFHWSLIYFIITIDPEISTATRIEKIEGYIKLKSWFGMIGCPLAWSFVSLFSYYLIGIAAQALKILIGKRLNAQLIAPLDGGKYELKTTVDRYKKENRKLKEDVENAEKERDSVKDGYAKKEETLEKEIDEKDKRISVLETTVQHDQLELKRKDEVIARVREEMESIESKYSKFGEVEEKLQEEINGLERENRYIKEARSPEKNKNDGQTVLYIIFGSGRWKMKLLGLPKYEEIFRYENGRFIVEKNEFIEKDEVIDISDVSFDDGVLTFYKENKKRNYPKRLVTLEIKGKGFLKGTENATETEYHRIYVY